MDTKPHCKHKTLLILLCLCTPPVLQADEWFKDPETGCAVWSDNPQPIVTIYWSGDCLEGKASGKGVLRVSIDSIPFSRYEGEYKDGKAHGYGVLTTPGDSRYEGEFNNNKMHGHGAIISADGKRIEGDFLDGNPHGILTITQPDGTSTELKFDHGKRVN